MSRRGIRRIVTQSAGNGDSNASPLPADPHASSFSAEPLAGLTEELPEVDAENLDADPVHVAEGGKVFSELPGGDAGSVEPEGVGELRLPNALPRHPIAEMPGEVPDVRIPNHGAYHGDANQSAVKPKMYASQDDGDLPSEEMGRRGKKRLGPYQVITEEFQADVREAMDRLRLTQKALAEAVDVDPSSITLLLRPDRVGETSRIIRKVAAYLQIPEPVDESASYAKKLAILKIRNPDLHSAIAKIIDNAVPDDEPDPEK